MSRGNAVGTIVGQFQLIWDVAPLRSGTAVKNFSDPLFDKSVIPARF
jgi:hypothetical protein